MGFYILLKGFALGLSMIVPIGSQNAMILNQGIARNHHLTTAALFVSYDILLIALGVLGGSLLLSSNDIAFNVLSWGGIIFLLCYGALSFQQAMNSSTAADNNLTKKKSYKVVIITTLVVTFLNPHVYIDTVMVIGSVGGQYQDNNKLLFMFGTMLASIVWFFTLAISAAKLSVQLNKPKVKCVIDIIVAIIMWSIAWSLYQSWLVH
jgi:L-lysine exporter family protein LysE/ArgO